MLSRIKNLFVGFLSLFISGIERSNPEALLEVEKERVRSMISQYNTALAPQAGMIERLKRQILQEEKNEKTLKAKIKANIKAGNNDIAGQLALQYQQLKTDLSENKTQLEQADETYKNLIRQRDVAMKEAKIKIEQIASGISRMRMNQANAELQGMATSMIGELGGGGDSLNRLETMVNDESDKAAGRARVAKDSINTVSIEMKESEQKALADQALADFAAESGIAFDASSLDVVSEEVNNDKVMGMN